MFIVWGEKRSEKPVGYAADFCPMCRAVRAVRVYRVKTVSHVYALSVGGGKMMGHTSRCQSCQHVREVNPTVYQQLVKKPVHDLAELEATTFPRLREVYATRLHVEEQLRAGREPLPEEIRAELIREPFAHLAPTVENRYSGEMRFDKLAALAGLVTLALPALLGVVAARSSDEALSGTLGGIAFLIFVGGFFMTLFLLITGPRRFVRNRIQPRLARTLRVLEPTRHELEQCLEGFRSMGFKIAKKTRADDLLLLLQDREQSQLDQLSPQLR